MKNDLICNVRGDHTWRYAKYPRSWKGPEIDTWYCIHCYKVTNKAPTYGLDKLEVGTVGFVSIVAATPL